MKHIISAATLSLAVAFPAAAQQPKTMECLNGVFTKCLIEVEKLAASERVSILTIFRHTGGTISNAMLIHPNRKHEWLNVQETLKKYGIRETIPPAVR